VLVAILLAVELAGILGALLAIPVAGIIQVVVRDVWDNRRGRPKQRPTVGAARAPVDARPRRRAGGNRRPTATARPPSKTTWADQLAAGFQAALTLAAPT
jgi:hypothetical protein